MPLKAARKRPADENEGSSITIRKSRRQRRMPPESLPIAPQKKRLKAKYVPPVEWLPPELLLRVFCFLPARELVLSAGLVSKRWRSTALSPALWRRKRHIYEDGKDGVDIFMKIIKAAPSLLELGVRGLPIPVGRPLLNGRLRTITALDISTNEICPCMLVRVLRRFTDSLEELTVCSPNPHMAQNKILEVWEALNQMKRLRSLRLQGCLTGRLAYSFPRRPRHEQTLQVLDLLDFDAEHASTVVSLVEAHGGSLLDVTFPMSMREEQMERALNALEHTRRVNMFAGQHVRALRRLAHLESVTVRYKIGGGQAARFVRTVRECGALSRLTHLGLAWGEIWMRAGLMETLAGECVNLRSLRLCDMSDDRPPGVGRALRHFKQIRELELYKFYPLDLDLIDQLGSGALPVLSSLTLSRCLISVPYSNQALCPKNPCFSHHLKRFKHHMPNTNVSHHNCECWHRRPSIRPTDRCRCVRCVAFYNSMVHKYHSTST